MPSSKAVIKDKDYCDLLYAWIQCHSERVSSVGGSLRRIEKSEIKWAKIEKDFSRFDVEKNKTIKAMERRTIAKYFNHLIEKGLITDNGDDYYYLELLPNDEANLIEYNTLSIMMNTMQRHCINIYIYLFNRYYANGCEPFVATIKQIKTYLGVATTTTSNNKFVSDSIQILQLLGLLKYKEIYQDEKTLLQFIVVKNKLPEVDSNF